MFVKPERLYFSKFCMFWWPAAPVNMRKCRFDSKKESCNKKDRPNIKVIKKNLCMYTDYISIITFQSKSTFFGFFQNENICSVCFVITQKVFTPFFHFNIVTM